MEENINYNSDKKKLIAEEVWSEEIPAVVDGETTLVSGFNGIFQSLFNRVKAVNILPFFKWNFGFDISKLDKGRVLDGERDLNRDTLTNDVLTEIETNRSYVRIFGKGLVDKNKEISVDSSDSVDSVATDKIATSRAVKKAFDKGVEAINLSNEKALKNGDTNEDFQVNNLYLKERKFIDFPSNSTERGPFNPIAAMLLKVGTQLYSDVDFKNSENQVKVYNNLGNDVVRIERVLGSTIGMTPPNSSGYVLKISHNGGESSPEYGGFIHHVVGRKNKTYVQIFQALVPKGMNLNLAENWQGDNRTSYWLTNTVGTGKWEWYVRVSHCGDGGSFHGGGHIFATSTIGNKSWYLACATVVDATAF